jgi:hypothetical protein
MSDASLPEPFAGMVTDAVRGWSNAISAAMWHQIRSELAVRQAEAEHAAYERVLRADASDPVVAQIVEQVTQRAMSKFIVIMARDAGVSESVMAATVAALTGQPVPPALQGEVWALLERAATQMATDAQQEAG